MLPPITPQHMATLPPFGSTTPHTFSFSPDGSRIACLWAEAGDLHRSLWLYTRQDKSFKKLVDASEGLRSFSEMPHSEELAREISRDPWLGLNSFSWAPDGQRLLIKTGSRLLLCNIETSDLQTYAHPHYITYASISPCGTKIVFQSERDLFLIGLSETGFKDHEAKALTQSTSPRIIHGVADKVTREEVYDGRAFWFLEKGQKLLLATYHLNNVPEVTIQSGHQNYNERIFYPKPGEPVPTTSISLLDLNTFVGEEILPASAQWPYLEGYSLSPEGKPLIAWRNRAQDSLKYLELDLTNGAHKSILDLKATPWINHRSDPLFAGDKGDFLLVSECDGPSEIRYYKGGQYTVLSTGAGHVSHILDVQEDKGLVYFIANNNIPTERHLFVVSLSTPSSPRLLSREPGVHTAIFAPTKDSWIHIISNLKSPPHVCLETLGGETEWEVPTRRTPSYLALQNHAPEIVTVMAADGKTPLFGALYKPHTPPENDQTAPLILMPYGGPSAPPRVLNDWSLTADLKAQAFAQAGCYVLKIDNRGTSGRGLLFECASHGQLGTLEVDDQAAAAQEIASRYSRINPHAIGITGGSYGGYMTLLCCLHYPDVFKAGVALMPVTDWRDYDAQYTERYMGAPTENTLGLRSNREGYTNSSVLTHISKLKSSVLVIHGLRDENVFFSHTSKLVEAAAQALVPIDFLPMPNDRHSFRNIESWTYVCYRSVLALLEKLKKT